MHKHWLKGLYIMSMLALPSAVFAQMSVFDTNKPVGFATLGSGTTGGEGGKVVTVTNADDLKKAMKGNEPAIIYLKGVITTNSQIAINSSANKTVIGLPGSVLTNPNHTDNKEETGVLALKLCNNIILRNVTFKSAGAYDIDGRDNLWISGSTNCWIDHCDFQDGVDGNLDISNASDNISITWCRFRYLKPPYKGGSGGSDDHRYSSLIGSNDKSTADNGKLNVTYQYCWWDEGCRERMPRVRYGKIHIANCLYSSTVTNYCIGAGYQSSVCVENSLFANINSKKGPFSASGENEECQFVNCIFRNTTGDTDGTGTSFNPTDIYKLKVTDTEPSELAIRDEQCGAGATLKVTEQNGVIVKEGSHNTYLKELLINDNAIPVVRGKFGYQAQVPFDFVAKNISASTLDTRATISDYKLPTATPGVASFKVTANNGDIAYYTIDMKQPSYATIQKTWQTSTFNAGVFVAIAMDKTNWSMPDGKKYYENKTVVSGNLNINGAALQDTKGLQFFAPLQKLRIDKSKNAIVLNSSQCTVTIPQCNKGDVITVNYVTASQGQARTITASNTIERKFAETTSSAMNRFTVQGEGDVVLKPSGSIIVYSISIYHP